ncbi:succinate dehydrogenase, partial [Verminephrobacter sp. Larva24]
MRSATPTPRARASDSGAAAPRRPRRAPPVLRALGWLLRAGLALLLAAGVLLWY